VGAELSPVHGELEPLVVHEGELHVARLLVLACVDVGLLGSDVSVT
jgi:hypothetical protein